MNKFIFTVAIVLAGGLCGCATMGYNAGLKAGRKHYFENKETKVSSYAWNFHRGWMEARWEWMNNKRR